MQPIHIFYKELPVDENNIFMVDITEKTRWTMFKKSVEYAVTGLSINQDINSKIVAVTDTDREHFLSNLIQKHVKDIKEPNLDLKISNPETSEVIIPFQRKYQVIFQQ